jgi:hypothetical protein
MFTTTGLSRSHRKLSHGLDGTMLALLCEYWPNLPMFVKALLTTYGDPGPVFTCAQVYSFGSLRFALSRACIVVAF